MIDVLITAGTSLATGAVSAWASWFFARKKYNSEVDNNLIENMQKSLEFYKQLSDDNCARLQEVLKRNEELSEEVKELRQQVFDLTMNICLDLSCKHRLIDDNIRKSSRATSKKVSDSRNSKS